MSFVDRLRRITPATWAAVFAVLLVFPWLGSFGFWDPWELGIAERAREMARSGHLTDVTAGGRYGKEPPLDLILAALGMKVFGVGELGARFGNGVFAVLALLAVYWAGAGLFRQRAALLATLALGTMPLFFLQARQLTSDMPLVAGLALALGGLGRFAWPGDGRRRWRDLARGAAGDAARHAVGWGDAGRGPAGPGPAGDGRCCLDADAGRSRRPRRPGWRSRAWARTCPPIAASAAACSASTTGILVLVIGGLGVADPDLDADHRQRGRAVFAAAGGHAPGRDAAATSSST